MKIDISIIASSVRTELYDDFFKSLDDHASSIEVIFAGPRPPDKKYPGLKYIETANIKPAQCYEIARRAASGEVIVWAADDCEFMGRVLDRAYDYWRGQRDKKLVLSLQTKESGYPNGKMYMFDMRNHTFFGYRRETPLMAPLAMMSRQYLQELGGFDRRFVCGQYENFTIMQVYADGGRVEVFGDKRVHVAIDHWAKSIRCGEGNFLKRPFASGYDHDRRILEKAWTRDGEIVWDQFCFDPYVDDGITQKSQFFSGKWD